MKVARFSHTRPLLTVSEILSQGSAGPDGQVVTSIGSNTVSWGSNVANIWVNGTTKVLGPEVNFANGTNTTVTVDMVGAVPSNTVRIHATGGGSVSFGSNSTRVSEISSAGASSDSSRADHIHDGIGTITSSSSNTMQRGTWNLRAGSGIALSLTDTDGDGEFDTTTIVNTGQGGGSSGSSSLTLISESVLGADAANIEIASIPGTYKDLVIRIVARCTTSAVTEDIFMRVGNGSVDTGNNYEYNVQFHGTTGTNSSATATSSYYCGVSSGATATAARFSAHELVLADYASTSRARILVGAAGMLDNTTRIFSDVSGVWKNTSQAITVVRIFPTSNNLLTGSRLAIYGRG